MKLSEAETRRQERQWQIGLALALCGGGAAVAGTAYGKMSERGKKVREQELVAAASDAQPRVYKDPDNASLEGKVTPQPTYTEGNQECRVIEDYLADGSQNESSLVKYCRVPDGEWKLKAI